MLPGAIAAGHRWPTMAASARAAVAPSVLPPPRGGVRGRRSARLVGQGSGADAAGEAAVDVARARAPATILAGDGARASARRDATAYVTKLSTAIGKPVDPFQLQACGLAFAPDSPATVAALQTCLAK